MGRITTFLVWTLGTKSVMQGFMMAHIQWWRTLLVNAGVDIGPVALMQINV
jgi:hypothetical protein